MLKKITSIILINSLLFPQYVFAACPPGTAGLTCTETEGVVDSNTPADDNKQPKDTKTKPKLPSAKTIIDKGKDPGQGGTQADQGGTQPDQGGTQADQGGTQADQGGTQPVKDETTTVPETPRGAGEKQLVGVVAARVAAEKFKLEPKFPPIPFTSKSGKPLEESGGVKFLGTSLFLNCQRQTARGWPEMVGTYKKKTTTDMWPDSWWSLAKSIEQQLDKYKLTTDEVKALKAGPKPGEALPPDTQVLNDDEQEFAPDDDGSGARPAETVYSSGSLFTDARNKIMKVKRFVKRGIARGKGKALVLSKCSALVPSTSFLDYNSSEDTLAITPKASLDRKIACRSRGAETQDYPSCRKLVSWWDGFFIGKKLMETAQKVKYQMDAKDRQEDLALDMASKNPDPLLPLKMQKAGIDDQAAVAFQNTFFLGAQYAVMQTKFSAWPSREEIVKTCQSAVTGTGGEPEKTTKEKLEAFAEKINPKKEDPKTKTAVAKEEDPNLRDYIDWFKKLITEFDKISQKAQINLLEDFKKESEIVASCPVPPMGAMGGSGPPYSHGDNYPMPRMPDFHSNTGSSSGEGEGQIGGNVPYENCDRVFMQNLQMDAQSQPQMPQGGFGPGSAMSVGQDFNESGSGGYPPLTGGSTGGMPGSEVMMGGMLGQSDDPCIDVMNSGTQLILNFQSREALKMVLVQTGIEALTNLMKGMMLRKQSAKIQSLIDGMPVPDPTLDKLSQKEEDLIASVCQIAPQEPICADFSNRSNGFNSPNIDLSPPDAATTLARVKAEAQGASAIEKEMAQIAATEFGESAAYSDAASGVGGGESKTPSVTFKAAEKGAGGGTIGGEATASQAVAEAEKGAGGEEAATPETGYTGGTEGREYKGPGFRADQYKGGQEGGLDKIAGGSGSMGFREPSSEGISPKEAGGLFKIISDRYESISKDRRIEGKSEIAK